MILLQNNNSHKPKNNSFFFIPHNWQTLIEIISETSSSLLYDNINEKGEKYFPFISLIFYFIILVNLIGLVPYSFTVTSHLIITFTMSLSIFIGVNIICNSDCIGGTHFACFNAVEYFCQNHVLLQNFDGCTV